MSRANFVQVQLAQAATDIQTTLSVKAPVGGFKLPPADGGRLVLTDSLGQPSAFEVITYTGRTGSGPYTLTGVVRGVEGTVGLAWGVDTFVLQALTVGDLQELMDSKLGVGATAVAAVKLATARTIGGVSFDGTANINLPGVNTAGNQNTSGNAATATKLATARTIGGVSFDGSANINLPGVNTSGNQNTSGNAATATKLATPRTIGGVSFDGSANIDLPGVNAAGNQDTSGNAATATKLAAARTINGVAFDGSADITVVDATKEPAIPAGTTAQYVAGNKTLRTFAADVRAAALTGLSTATNSAIAAADTVLAAFGKLQAQITGLATSKLDANANAVSASKLQTARTINGVPFDGTANITWTLAEIGAVTSDVDTTPGRLLTTDYLDIGKLDKTFWPKATSLLTLKNGPDRTVWVGADTVDAPHPGFYGTVTSRRLSSTTAIIEAQPLFELARYIYVSTGFGDSGWVKETMHEVGEWVDLRPYLLSPYYWKSARDGNNHFPQIRLVDWNTVELRGIASYNASSAAPPTGIAFRVPEAFRPQMTSAGLCFSDAESPLWFGHALYIIQGQVNYNGLPAWAQGNVQIVPYGAPNPVADGAVDLSGIRYYLS